MAQAKKPLDDTVTNELYLGSIFPTSKEVTSIDFHRDGDFCVTASADGLIQFFDCRQGKLKKKIWSKKYGVEMVRFTHHSYSVLCTSKGYSNHDIRYLSLYDNSYIRFFAGHKDRVCTLSMSPTDDSFVSGSMDGTVRIWLLKSQACQAVLKVQTGFRPFVSYDPTGVVMAVATDDCSVRFYDCSEDGSKLQQGPFEVMKDVEVARWTDMFFSPAGDNIIASTKANHILRYDAYSPFTEQKRYSLSNEKKLPLHAACSPDSRYVCAGGTQAGGVHIWNLETGKEIVELKAPGQLKCEVTALKWHPTRCLLVACSSKGIQFWIP